MKFKFIGEAERRALLIKAAGGGAEVTFCYLNGRRFVVEDGVVCLVEGLDEIIGARGSLTPLTNEELQRVTNILSLHTKSGD